MGCLPVKVFFMACFSQVLQFSTILSFRRHLHFYLFAKFSSSAVLGLLAPFVKQAAGVGEMKGCVGVMELCVDKMKDGAVVRGMLTEIN